MIAIIENQKGKCIEVELDNNFLSGVLLDEYKVNGKIDGLFSKANIVADAWRYDLIFNNGQFQIIEGDKELETSEFKDKSPFKVGGRKVILLLLESPHKKEFVFDEGRITPKAPAQGKGPGDAGGAIAKYLHLILKKTALPQGEYSVIISNPVPYHASLGHFKSGKLDKNLRDHVWRKIWSLKNIQCTFKEKLRSYSPFMILNCCTTNLTRHVNCFLCENGYKDRTYVVSHPAVNWNINKANTEVISLEEWKLTK